MPVGREAGLATIERRCRGVMCAMSTRPKDINVNCLFALCKQCCVRAHQTLPAIRPCNIGDHRRGTPGEFILSIVLTGVSLMTHSSTRSAPTRSPPGATRDSTRRFLCAPARVRAPSFDRLFHHRPCPPAPPIRH